MSSRCIKLTRIHAIQWFGYCDTFDIQGNLLVAGRTGAGKSVLMDLIQLVLIGDKRARYNAASDGRGQASGRDKKSYCLCDVQEDVNGVPQYARDGGTTYVALEFAWPENDRIETWGMRIEYANAETQNPDEEFFLVPGRLERSDFVTPDGYALDLDGFRHLLREREGVFFRNISDYRRQLADHLNFHRETIDFLMPSAMSFAFLPRFDEFCRRYILQAEEIKIEPIQQSYQNYLRISDELNKLRDKTERLERTVNTRLEWEKTRIDADVLRFLEVEYRKEAAHAEHAELLARLESLDAKLQEEKSAYDEVVSTLEKKRETLESLKNLFRDEGGAAVLELQNAIKKVVQQISHLRTVGEAVAAEQARRVRHAAEFQKLAEQFLDSRPGMQSDTTEEALDSLAEAIAGVKEASPETLRAALRTLAQAVRATLVEIQEAVKPDGEDYAEVKRELEALQEQLRNLESNRVMLSPLLDELNRRLPRKGKEPAAQQLRELCEVLDEEWRPAIELAFTRKFAIVVTHQYEKALAIYKEFKGDSERESLVDPDRALKSQRKPLPNSLATKIATDHPVARAVVDELFGSLVCVDTIEELRKCPNDAIMKDGFRTRGLFAERPRRYDQRPCIGSRGIERLRAHLTAQAEQCAATLRQLEPSLNRAAQLDQFAQQHQLLVDDLEADIARASQLHELEAERDRLIARNSAAVNPELEERVRLITELENEIRALDQQRLELHGRLQSGERAALLRRIESAGDQKAMAEQQYQNAVSLLGGTLNMKRREELHAEYTRLYPVPSVRANNAAQAHVELSSRLPGLDQQVRLLRQSLIDQHPDLRAEPDFDPDTGWNKSYQVLLERIRVEDMPARQQAAREEEQRWQDLFRTTVAARLSQAIREVKSTINLLNLQLKKPIGDSLYRITVVDNPSQEYQEYRRVLEACAITADGESIFTALSAETREAVERVFRALVNDPNGKIGQAFLDYRSYYRYDMEVSHPKRPELGVKSLNRHADKFSGGEKQTPFYICILACYLRAYKRHLPDRYTEPSLGLVPIDEAFSKMSGERITDAIRALRDVDLQGILSMSSGNWPYAIGECDQVLAIHQRDEFINNRKTIRNIGALLTREQALERTKDWE